MIVTAHFHEHGSVLKGDAEGFCDGFDIEIKLDTEEDDDTIATLIRVARKMCFTEKVLTGSVPVHVTQTINQQPFVVDET